MTYIGIRSRGSMKSKEMTTEEILESYKQLGENWDSDGAEPISHIAIAKAQEIIAANILPFDTAPLCNGGIDLEYDWNWPHGILVEVCPDGSINACVVTPDRKNEYDYSSYSVDSIPALREIVRRENERHRDTN